jgi:hypothetical protein
MFREVDQVVIIKLYSTQNSDTGDPLSTYQH